MQSSKMDPLTFWKEAELNNGRFAMIGLFALVHNYVLTGWIAPGLF